MKREGSEYRWVVHQELMLELKPNFCKSHKIRAYEVALMLNAEYPGYQDCGRDSRGRKRVLMLASQLSFWLEHVAIPLKLSASRDNKVQLDIAPKALNIECLNI